MEKDTAITQLQATITNFVEEFVNGKKVTFYKIECILSNGKNWTVKRRFSEFEKLFEELKKTHRQLPNLPGKTMFAPTNKDDIERRRKGLDDFVKNIITREDFYCKKEFIEFLELDKEQASLAVNQMEALAQITDSIMGYRDATLFVDHNIAVAALHYVKLTSRLDSYFGSLFKKKNEQSSKEVTDKETVGMVQFMHGSSSDISEYSTVWKKKYTSQAICITASIELAKIAVGLDSGDIYVYGFDPKNPKKEPSDDFALLKAHSGRVMKLVFDAKLEKLYSIGDDKKLRVTGLKSRDNDQHLKTFDKGLTDICFDQKNLIAYIADSGSNIYTVDLSKSLPALGQKIKLNCAGPLRGLDVDWTSGTIFTCSYGDGHITVLKTTDIADAVDYSRTEY